MLGTLGRLGRWGALRAGCGPPQLTLRKAASATKAGSAAAISAPLHGTVQELQRHVFVLDGQDLPVKGMGAHRCCAHEEAHDGNGHESWDPRLENAVSGHILSEYQQVVEARGEQPPPGAPLTAKFTAAVPQGASVAMFLPTVPDRHSVLIFPESVVVTDIEPTQVDAVVDVCLGSDVTVDTVRGALNLQDGDQTVSAYPGDALAFFVCVHGTRDLRCGQNGPQLVQWLRELFEKEGVADRFHLFGTSHIGGHRHAANLVLEPFGEWFGLVNTEERAAALVSWFRAFEEGKQASVSEQDKYALQQMYRGTSRP